MLGATYDAAYFALAAEAAPVEFLERRHALAGSGGRRRPGRGHPGGAPPRSGCSTRSSRTRGWTRRAVIPAPRPPRERVTLTAPQWELLVHADGQRTPADLAQLLGRAGFATIQELRRLAALGLIELPEVRAESPDFVRLPRARGTAVAVRRPVFGADDAPTVPVATGVHPVIDAPSVPAVSGVARQRSPPAGGVTQPAGPPPASPRSHAAGTVYRPPRLARRKPGAKLPKEFAAEPPQTHPGTDEVLLKRIRTALRALR